MSCRRALTGICLSLVLFCGCAGLRRADWPQGLEGVAPTLQIASVPFFAQEQYQCGPAALAMVLGWSGLDVGPDELKEKVYTASLKGSLQPAMIAAARRHGRLAYEISGAEALIRELAAGHPVVVLQNLGLSWMPLWHYAVVIGYDLPEEELILHTGRNAAERITLSVFQNTWHRAYDWGLLVLAPGEVPATAVEEKFVQAVHGLERANRPAAAVQGYLSALSRWPTNLAAMMGLGNSYFALGDLYNSEAAFRRTAEAYPEEGSAFNNLAHVLQEQGRRQEALAAAQQAVSLGGPHLNVFRKTLEEIQTAGP